MHLHFGKLRFATTAGTDILDITEEVEEEVTRAGVQTGLLTVGVAGSTASVTTIEFEPGVVNDLRRAIERAAPQDLEYAHDARWGDGNGYAHVRSALLGPSITLPIQEGQPVLGTWQQVVLCDFDNRPRQREVYVQILGA
jgi:secondary thiamine-phosphate synthase enzyme